MPGRRFADFFGELPAGHAAGQDDVGEQQVERQSRFVIAIADGPSAAARVR